MHLLSHKAKIKPKTNALKKKKQKNPPSIKDYYSEYTNSTENSTIIK